MAIELHMIPVPAGDATLIIDRSGERPYSVLIDAGLAQHEIVSYLQNIGLFHLDLIILSHPDLDHLKGLLSLIENPLISIDQMWCFDLTFLREFVKTGTIPRPRDPTHIVLYLELLRTLDGMDKVLTSLGNRQVLTLQVSSGHKINLGKLHIEVLYPWDGFYNALSSPRRIKQLLSKRWPHDWTLYEPLNGNFERERVPKAHSFTREQEEDFLRRHLERLDLPELDDDEDRPLANPGYDESEEEMDEDENDESFPISKLGTLYNNLSIVVKVHVLGGISPPTMLFPGDLTDWTYLIARNFDDLQADIFKYPHHGSSGPGMSHRVFRKYFRPFHGCCPCGPWCHPECEEIHYRYWLRFEDRIQRIKTAPDLFYEFVMPRHTLIFPYPSQRLPKQEVITPSLGKIHVNRQYTEPDMLADSQNPATPCILKIGFEHNQIKS